MAHRTGAQLRTLTFLIVVLLLGQLVQAGVFGTRAEAASFLIDEGIKTQTALFERVEQKLAEIERLRAELRGLVGERKTEEPAA